MQTKTFQFPNQGHSVRKLIASLEELPRDMLIRENIEMIDEGYQVSFKEVEYGTLTVQHLLNVLPRLGSRFTLEVGSSYTVGRLDGTSVTRNHTAIKFHFDWSDVTAHPHMYCN